ncbi:hypothetical protein MIMGU_mgv1a026399mg [Erythranthe guttata]|uniref:Multipolar spindle 1 n=1 Tax=Erythranthe guttata TaxID=4155 RepID=A0A022R6P0_ERYGU|nr:hypothetical protein MIMGU_mgv1a026399mg [Erythranthe guttata]
MENPAKQQANGDLDPSLKLALALAIVKTRRRQKLPSSSAATAAAAAAAANGDSQGISGDNSKSDAIKWKTKAKQRKEEILRLKEDLKIAEDGVYHDVFPQNVSCKCYFYDNLGQLSPKSEYDQQRIGDVLRRRFLRQDTAIESEMEQLRASVDFLVELCETSSPREVEESKFKNWSHQAVDFILATLKALLSGGKIDEKIESIVSSLIMRLMRRMCNESQGEELAECNTFQFYVQHLMRKLGSDPYVGQRVILSVSQRISIVAESLLFVDPFDGAFPKMHNCMYIMIQLIEFLISDNLLSWSTRQDFDTKLLEEWVLSVFHARKGLDLLESRNSLYMLYMDRVVGDLTRHLGQDSFIKMLRPDALDKLFG